LIRFGGFEALRVKFKIIRLSFLQNSEGAVEEGRRLQERGKSVPSNGAVLGISANNDGNFKEN
jgi:hypothetical protein